MACLDNETATAYLRGDLEPEEADRWAAHLAECDSCRQLVQEVSALMDAVRRELMLAYSDPIVFDWRRADRVVRGTRSAARRIPSLSSLRPHFVGASLATAVALVLFIVWWRETPVTAAEALRRAAVAEQATATNVSEIVHRTLTVEERRHQSVVRRQRVEIWQNAANRTKVRRLYNEAGHLVAGEWTLGDGSRSIYQRDKAPVTERVDAPVPMNSDNMWRWEPSVATLKKAKAESNLLLQYRGNAYVLRTKNSQPPSDNGIVSLELTLAADDFRPVAQTLFVDKGGELHEFALAESTFEALPLHRVEAARFVPESELLPPTSPAVTPAASSSNILRPPTPPTPRVDPHRPDRLAMQAWYRLHSVGLIAGQDAFVHVTSAGKVRVDVSVASDLRRTVILQRLESIAQNEWLDANVRVTPHDPTSGIVTANWSENVSYQRIRDRLLPTIPDVPDRGHAIEVVTRETVRWLLEESSRLQSRTAALTMFSSQWPPQRLAKLDLDTLAQWQTIVRDYAVDAGQRAEALRERCDIVLGAPQRTASANAVGPLDGPDDVDRLAERLSRLASRQQSILSTAFQATSAASTEQSAALDAAELTIVLTEIGTIAGRFAGPWSLGR